MEVGLFVALVAMIIGLAQGGSPISLIDTRFNRAWLLALALVVQLAFVAWPPSWLTRPLATVIFLGTELLVVAFLLLNRRLPGVAWVAIGLGLNAIVIGVNGAMPVSATAARMAGTEFLTDTRHVEHGLHLRNEAMSANTRLRFMSDVIPVPVLEKVLSGGDLRIAGGIGLLVYRRVRSEGPPIAEVATAP
jgi:hypothetical protein